MEAVGDWRERQSGPSLEHGHFEIRVFAVSAVTPTLSDRVNARTSRRRDCVLIGFAIKASAGTARRSGQPCPLINTRGTSIIEGSACRIRRSSSPPNPDMTKSHRMRAGEHSLARAKPMMASVATTARQSSLSIRDAIKCPNSASSSITNTMAFEFVTVSPSASVVPHLNEQSNVESLVQAARSSACVVAIHNA